MDRLTWAESEQRKSEQLTVFLSTERRKDYRNFHFMHADFK